MRLVDMATNGYTLVLLLLPPSIHHAWDVDVEVEPFCVHAADIITGMHIVLYQMAFIPS